VTSTQQSLKTQYENEVTRHSGLTRKVLFSWLVACPGKPDWLQENENIRVDFCEMKRVKVFPNDGVEPGP